MRAYGRRRRRLNPRFVVLCLSAVLLVLTAAVIAALVMKARPLPGEEEPGEERPVPEYVEKDYLPVNEWSRPGEPLEKIRGVVIHYVGNPGTSAQANRNYFASLASGGDGVYASSHFVVGLEGEVVQCVPLTEIAYASNSRNDDTVAIEICHPEEDGKFAPETYDRAVELTAWLCREFQLDPEKDVIRHYDITGKDCPKYYVENPGAWEKFREDVAAAEKALKAEAESGR